MAIKSGKPLASIPSCISAFQQIHIEKSPPFLHVEKARMF
jgi:hypothetical protein